MIYARCSELDDGEPSQVFVASPCVQVKRGRKVSVIDASDGEPSQVSHVESMRVQGDTQASDTCSIPVPYLSHTYSISVPHPAMLHICPLLVSYPATWGVLIGERGGGRRRSLRKPPNIYICTINHIAYFEVSNTGCHPQPGWARPTSAQRPGQARTSAEGHPAAGQSGGVPVYPGCSREWKQNLKLSLR